jgi:predicted Fe-Mo cluster-binding NifX family protein
MKIAISSQDFATITGHAGRASRFLVYQAELAQEPQLVEQITLSKDMTFHEYHAHAPNAPHPLDGTELIITTSAGENFQQRVTARGIRLAITDETDPVSAIKQFFAGTLTQLESHANCSEHHHDTHH